MFVCLNSPCFLTWKQTLGRAMYGEEGRIGEKTGRKRSILHETYCHGDNKPHQLVSYMEVALTDTSDGGISNKLFLRLAGISVYQETGRSLSTIHREDGQSVIEPSSLPPPSSCSLLFLPPPSRGGRHRM